MFGKIRTRLTTAFIGLAVSPILFLGIFIAQKTYTSATTNAQRVTQETALRVAGNVEDFIRGMAEHIELVTKVYGLQNVSQPKRQEILSELLSFQNSFDEIALLDSTGMETIRVNRTNLILDEDLISRAGSDEFLIPSHKQEIYFGPVYFHTDTGEPQMVCAVPFSDPQTGKTAGIIVGVLRLKKMWDMLSALHYRPDEQVYITDSQGAIIAHQNPSIVLRGTSTSITYEGVQNNRMHHGGLLGTGSIIGDHDIFLGNQRLHVVSEWQKTSALSLAYRLLLFIGLGTLVALAVAVLVVIPVVGNIVRPIQDLAATARRIEEGNWSEQAREDSDDEIGELARAFNAMTAQLRNSMTTLKKEVCERTGAQKALQHELLINESLAAVSKVLLGTEDLKEIAEEILRRALTLTGSQHGYVGYIDQNTRNLVSPTMTAMMGKECQLQGEQRTIEFPPEPDGRYGHLWGVPLNTKQPFIANTPQDHPASTGCPEGHVPIHRFISVPILFNDRLIGQIALANAPHKYKPTDIGALERLGRLYALALNRAHNSEEKDRLLRDLRQSQKMEAIGTLAGGIAHDFNNMLTPIMGYSELALTQLTRDDALYEHIEAINQAAERAKNLIKQILTFSRQREHDLSPMAIQPILRETIKLLRSSLPATIAIREDIDPACGAILSDLTQFQQIIMNLGTNAYHAMGDDGGTLTITLKQLMVTSVDPLVDQGLPSGPTACLSISDTGCGMDKAILDRIFEPYFTTKEQGKGTGMGLAMVHAIISSQQGHINVESIPGKGTTFKIYFPIASPEAVSEQKSATMQAMGGHERILLVDDEEPIILMLSDMLKQFGYKVTGISRSPEALSVFQDHPNDYDLVITDQTMPELTGGELAQKMLEIRPDIPIILCTGFSASFTEDMARKLGIREYIMKPVIIRELTEKIRALVNQHPKA